MNTNKNIIFALVISLLTSFLACSIIDKKRQNNTVGKDEFDVMILIPAGEFIMGSNIEEKYEHVTYDEKEFPQRKVFVDAFYIGKYEVTNKLFKRFIDDGGYHKKEYWLKEGWEHRKRIGYSKPSYWVVGDYHTGPDYPDHPVVGVGWWEAMAYAKWAGARLPTETEWEKAARGADGRIWPWGNEFDTSRANTAELRMKASTPVGSFPNGASPYGIMDMARNVSEWMGDLHHKR